MGSFTWELSLGVFAWDLGNWVPEAGGTDLLALGGSGRMADVTCSNGEKMVKIIQAFF